VAEIDYKPASFNITNVLTRRPEQYHHKVASAGQAAHGEGEILSIHDRVAMKGEALDKKLIFDSFLRRSFLDRLFENRPTPQALQAEQAEEKGDFASGRYKLVSAEKKDAAAVIVLSREGTVVTGGRSTQLTIRKTYNVDAKEQKLACSYRIKNGGQAAVRFTLGVEWNFTLLAADAADRYITIGGEKYKMNSIGSDDGVKSWTFSDEYFRFLVELSASRPVTLLRYPVETVSQSEGGFESNYQGTAFTVLVDVDIEPGKTFSHKFTLACRSLNQVFSAARQLINR
jgi:alpha-amylase